MKKLFVAIRNGDLDGVKALIDKKPELVFCTAKQPPKKDDGQSPLQVALKVGNTVIAEYLLDKGADVNFIEKESCNDWTAPVLHDCIRATILNCRTVTGDVSKFDRNYSLLMRMLSMGANPNMSDSYGNTCLGRAILDAQQMIQHPFFKGETSWAGKGLTEEECNLVLSQIRSVFRSLIDAGADINLSSERRPSAVDDIKSSKLEEFELF